MKARTGRILLALCFAFPIVLAFLPTTGWIVKSNLRYFAGIPDWTALGYKDSDIELGVSFPDFYDLPPTGSDRDSRLTAFGFALDKPEFEKKFAALKKSWNDADFLAAFVLEACEYEPIFTRRIGFDNLGYPETTDVAKSNRNTWIMLREACDQGARVEPDNALFPALSATVSSALGETDRALTSLDQSAQCTRWDNHRSELGKAYRSAMLGSFGYRGSRAFILWPLTADPVRNLHGLAADISRRPFDKAGVRARRNMLHFAELAYRSADSYQEVERAAAIVNRVVWYGPATEMTQSQARQTLLIYLAETSNRIGLEGSQGSSLREMIAAEDFRSAHHLGPAWEYNPAPEWEPNDNSWWDALTVPEQGAGQNATYYSVVAFAIAVSLVFALLTMSMIRALRVQIGSQPIFNKPVVAAVLAGIVWFLAFAWIGLTPMIRLPLFSWPAWVATLLAATVLAVVITAALRGMSVREAASKGRGAAWVLCGMVSVVYGLGVIWQLGVDVRAANILGQNANTGERARQWAHENPNGQTLRFMDTWWRGA